MITALAINALGYFVGLCIGLNGKAMENDKVIYVGTVIIVSSLIITAILIVLFGIKIVVGWL